jgi:hypothetical protein
MKSKKTQYQSYLFTIDNAKISYSFALDREGEGPYREHLELTLLGTMVLPEHFRGRQGTLTLLGNRRTTDVLENPIQSRLQPIAIGKLTIWGKTTGYLGSLPADALWRCHTRIVRGDIKMLELHGEVLYRGSAKILSMHFEWEIDPQNW